jgi:cbb3-type cytochrome oxidase subunit 1
VPALTVYALRIALSYLGTGFTIGALMLGVRGVSASSEVLRLRPLHLELLLIGWTVQLAFGVAFWILPRRSGLGRGNERLAWGSLLLLNLGVLTVGVGSVLSASPGVLIAGRSAELLAGLAFAAHAWPRARGYSVKNGSS